MGGIDGCKCNSMDEGGREQQQQLIPGLPDEIGMECLVRVPYGSHSRMKSVCRGWRTLISHPSFYEQRRKARTAEHLVCLVQPLQFQFQYHADVVLKERERNDKRQQQQEEEEEDCHLLYRHPSDSDSDPLPLYQYGLSIFSATHQTWQQVMMPDGGMDSSMPMLFCHCVALPSSRKLLLGGWDPTTLDPVPRVYVLDLIGDGEQPQCRRWRRAAPMSVARSFFACAVVGRSTLYVAGGMTARKTLSDRRKCTTRRQTNGGRYRP